jgi:hypothetical protein
MKYLVLILILFSAIVLTWAQELIPKEKKNKWGFVNKNNEWVIKAKFSEVKNFKEGLACVRVKKKWGFINTQGKKAIPFQYSKAKSFENGLAAVRSFSTLPGNTRESNNQYKWGYIEQSGNQNIPYLFKAVNDFDKKERALVQLFEMKSNEFFWINPQGEAISPPFTHKEKIGETYKVENIRNDGVKVYRYLSISGTPITEWYLNDFSLDKQLIKVWLPSKTDNDTVQETAFKGNVKNKLCAFIDKEGKVLSPWYSEIKDFVSGYAPVRHNHKYGFIDSNFTLVKKPTYRELNLLQDNIYKGQIEYGKTALLDQKGKELSLYCFDFEPYQGKLFLGKHQLKSSYRSENKYALFDESGNQKTSWYNKIHAIHNSIVRVEDERATYNGKNNLEYEVNYNYVSLETGELISTWRPSVTLSWEKGKEDSILTYLFLSTSIINLEKAFFKSVFIKEFNYLKNEKKITFTGGDFHNGMALVAKKGEETTTIKNGIEFKGQSTLYGYIDWYGDLVIPYRYKQGAAFRDQYAVVGDGNLYGAINSKGRKVLPNKQLILGAYGSGLFPFLDKDGHWGYINRESRVQIKPQYDQALPFSYGYASVKKGRYWGLIDVMGNELMKFDYRKPMEMISPLKVRYLKNGIGYTEILISDLLIKN